MQIDELYSSSCAEEANLIKRSYCDLGDLALGKSASTYLCLFFFFFFFKKDCEILHMVEARISGL